MNNLAIKVSVVIPTYNRPMELARALESLTKQTFKEFEVLVCDDGSTRDSSYIVKHYENQLNIRFYKCKHLGGPARARNTGIKHATSEYIAFLDSDDWWCPEKLAKSVRMLDDGADVVYHDLIVVRKMLPFQKRTRVVSTRKLYSPVFHDLLIGGCGLANSSVVLRTSLIRETGGFLESKRAISAEDYLAWLSVSQLTEKFVKIDSPLGFYSLSNDSVSTSLNKLRSYRFIIERYKLDFYNINKEIPHWILHGLLRCYIETGQLHKSLKILISVFKSKSTMLKKIYTILVGLKLIFRKLRYLN